MINATINNHHFFNEYGLYLKERSIGSAQPNLYKKSVPGMNGDIDYTSFFGDVTFQNRQIKAVFFKKVDSNTQKLKYDLENMFNGKEVKITFSDDPLYYWKGKCTIDSNDDDTKIYQIEIAIDAYPFKFKLSDDSEVR